MNPLRSSASWIGFGLLFVVSTALAAVDQTRIDAARSLYLDAAKSSEAQSAFDAIAREDPKNVAAHLYLGRLAIRRDDMDQAIAHLEQAVQLDPNNAEAHQALGNAYGRSAQKASIFKQLGFAKKCLASYQRAVALAPDRVEFQSSLFDYYSQAPGFAGGGFDKALAVAETMKKLDASRGRIALARLYANEKRWEEAFAQFDEALKTNPDDYIALYQIGRLAATSGQFVDRGVTALRRCLQLPVPAVPDPPSHAAAQWRLGQLLEKKGDKPAARTAYEAAVKLDPNFAPATEALKKLR